MHPLTKIFILACAAALLAGCQPVTPDIPSTPGKTQVPPGVKQLVQADLPRVNLPPLTEEQQAAFSAGQNSFAFDLYQRINQNQTGNLIFSPYSIWQAFSMVYGGARGDTESQMQAVFHFLSQDSQHTSLNALDQRLQAVDASQESDENGTPFQLQLANAVWAQPGFPIQQPYLDLLATQYGAGLRLQDFQADPDAAIQAINDWVDENTGGRIKDIANDSIDRNTLFVLTNAIYFKAGWLNKFDPAATADGPFTLLDGTQVTVPLMHVEAQLQYAETPDYQAVLLPYADYKTGMWVILPAQGQFSAVQTELSQGLMDEIQHQSGIADVTLSMPGFDFESALPLKKLLSELGLTKAFCPEGDFSGISGGLCISAAVHKATIKVDEEGTEATAATLVAMMTAMFKQVQLTVDRPFIFAIVDRDSGLILFLGQVVNPAEK